VKVFALALLAFALPLTNACTAPSANQPRVVIKEQTFSVEVVRAAPDWQKGLMFREKLGPREGMLFFGTEEIMRGFWMKNTLISLDIIYISRDLKIVHIVKRTEPLSEKILPSIKPALHVFEILGGQSDKFGIGVGDSVKFISVR